MNRAIVMLLCASLATAASASTDELRLNVQEMLVIEVAGVTAAYVVDGSIAEVAVIDGKVHIHALRAGLTTLSVIVLPQEIILYDLVVLPIVKVRTLTREQVAAKAARNMAETQYNSATGRLMSSVTSTTSAPGSMTRLAVTNATYVGAPAGDARVSFPALTFEIVRGPRQLTLFDHLANSSAFQRGARNIRGVHYQTDRLELHAGLLSPALYRDVIFSPASSSKVISARYQIETGWLTIAPQASWNDSDTRGYGVSGFAPTLQIRPTDRSGEFDFAGEIGYGRGAAAAGSLSFDNVRNHLSLRADHVPRGFPMPGGGPPPGSIVRGEVGSRVSSRVSVTLNAEAARQHFVNTSQTTGFSIAEMRTIFSPRWSATVGSTYSVFSDDRLRVNTVSLPVELSWKNSRAGVSTLARYLQNTTQNRGGMGGRLRGHARLAGFTFGGSADYQREAATIDLVFRETPELEQIFTELGLLVTSPEELLRLIQDNTIPGLAEFLERSTVNLSPWRLQSRADARWTSPSRKDLVQFSLVSDRRASTSTTLNHFMTTLAYTRRLGAGIDVTGSGTRWMTAVFGRPQPRWSYTLGIRARLSGADGLGSIFRRQSIRGQVFRDDTAEGMPLVGTSPMARVRVLLDDGQETVTGADGQFEFEHVGRGVRRVNAILPSSSGLRFTTASAFDVTRGQAVSFGIGRLPGRLTGQARDDAGGPIQGVKMVLVCAGQRFDATTDSSGRYAITGPEGACSVWPDTSSLPAGYDAGDPLPQAVMLASNIPAQAGYVFRAMRSLTGVVGEESAGRPVTLHHASGNVVQAADDTGRFAFRNLSPGVYTVTVATGGKQVERRVELPAGPALVELDLRHDK